MIYYGKTTEYSPTFYKRSGNNIIILWNLSEHSQIEIFTNTDMNPEEDRVEAFIPSNEQEFNEAFNIAIERIKTI